MQRQQFRDVAGRFGFESQDERGAGSLVDEIGMPLVRNGPAPFHDVTYRDPLFAGF
jgi:hypothetical protein